MADQHLARTLRQVTVVFAVTVAVLLGALVFAFATRDQSIPVYDPLGDFPTQQVTTVQPIPVGQDVGVDAIQCNDSKDPVRVAGTRVWTSVDPAGSPYAQRGGIRVLAPGCAHIHFENPMPAEVIARVQQLAAVGKHTTVWVITGTATPIPPDGERPVVKAYTTAAFRISA